MRLQKTTPEHPPHGYTAGLALRRQCQQWVLVWPPLGILRAGTSAETTSPGEMSASATTKRPQAPSFRRAVLSDTSGLTLRHFASCGLYEGFWKLTLDIKVHVIQILCKSASKRPYYLGWRRFLALQFCLRLLTEFLKWIVLYVIANQP